MNTGTFSDYTVTLPADVAINTATAALFAVDNNRSYNGFSIYQYIFIGLLFNAAEDPGVAYFLPWLLWFAVVQLKLTCVCQPGRPAARTSVYERVFILNV